MKCSLSSIMMTQRLAKTTSARSRSNSTRLPVSELESCRNWADKLEQVRYSVMKQRRRRTRVQQPCCEWYSWIHRVASSELAVAGTRAWQHFHRRTWSWHCFVQPGEAPCVCPALTRCDRCPLWLLAVVSMLSCMKSSSHCRAEHRTSKSCN